MNISNHAMERWALRQRGHEKDYKTYIAQNKDIIERDMLASFEASELVYSGILNTKNKNATREPRNYWIKDKMCFITDKDDTVIITCYLIDFGYETKTDLNKEIISTLMESIKELKATKDSLDTTVEKAELDLKINDVNNKIESLQLGIDDLKNTKELYTKQKANLDFKDRQVDAEITKHARDLFNSKFYLEDQVNGLI